MTNTSSALRLMDTAPTQKEAPEKKAVRKPKQKAQIRLDPITKISKSMREEAAILSMISDALMFFALVGSCAIGALSTLAYEYLGIVAAIVDCVAGLVFGGVMILLALVLSATSQMLKTDAKKLRKGGRK